MQSIRKRWQFRTAAAAVGVLACFAAVPAARAQVSGRVAVTDVGGKPAGDIGNAVVYWRVAVREVRRSRWR